MIKILELVSELNKEDIAYLREELNGTKLSELLTLLNNHKTNDIELCESLKVTKSALYTLKSRLRSRIKEYFLDKICEKNEIIDTSGHIDKLIFETPKKKAKAVFLEMEKNLLSIDNPFELLRIYSGLKKIGLENNSIYSYSQNYNKQESIIRAIESAEDLLTEFNRFLGEYDLSKQQEHLSSLLFVEQEFKVLTQLYRSDKLRLYHLIINLSMALLADQRADKNEVEKMLEEMLKLIDINKKLSTFRYFKRIYNFFAFQYFISLGSNQSEYFFEELKNDINQFMLYGYCCYYSRFFISEAEAAVINGTENQLITGLEKIKTEFEPLEFDQANFFNFQKYSAICYFYAGNYDKCQRTLNNLINSISFKNRDHAEIEIKLFLSLAFSLQNKYESASLILGSLKRKMRNIDEKNNYEHVRFFVKMLFLQIQTHELVTQQKMLELRDRFTELNVGKYRMLSFLKLDDQFVGLLSKGVK